MCPDTTGERTSMCPDTKRGRASIASDLLWRITILGLAAVAECFGRDAAQQSIAGHGAEQSVEQSNEQ